MDNPETPVVENKPRGSKKKMIFTLLILVVVIMLLMKLGGNIQEALFRKKATKEKAAAVKLEEEAAPVKVYKVKRTDLKDTLPAIGNVKGFKEVDLKFQVAGVIESFNFEEGERIQEGDIIASLIQKDALLKLKYAEAEFTKNQKLYDIGALSPVKLEQGKLEYESAKSELDKTNIYAMNSGMLGSRIMDVGSYVTPNDKVGVFVDIDKVYAEFNIIERDIPKLALGQKVEVFADALPGKVFNGAVDRISPIIEGKSRTENIKVELENKESALRPGMFVRAVISTYDKKDVIVVPFSAIKEKDNVRFVYAVAKIAESASPAPVKTAAKPKSSFWPFGKANKKEEAKPQTTDKAPETGVVEIRKIKVSYATSDLAEIEEGLSEDEIIIIEAQEDFKDKAKVEISETQEGLL